MKMILISIGMFYSSVVLAGTKSAADPYGTWEERHGEMCVKYSLTTNHTGSLNFNGHDQYFTWELKGDTVKGTAIGARGTTCRMNAEYDREKNVIRMDVPKGAKVRGFTGEFKYVGPEVLTNLTETCEQAKKEWRLADVEREFKAKLEAGKLRRCDTLEQLFDLKGIEARNLRSETADGVYPKFIIRNYERLENSLTIFILTDAFYGLNSAKFPLAKISTKDRKRDRKDADERIGLSSKERARILTLADKYKLEFRENISDFDGRFSYWSEGYVMIDIYPEEYDNVMPFIKECFDGKLKFPRYVEEQEMERRFSPDEICSREEWLSKSKKSSEDAEP